MGLKTECIVCDYLDSVLKYVAFVRTQFILARSIFLRVRFGMRQRIKNCGVRELRECERVIHLHGILMTHEYVHLFMS